MTVEEIGRRIDGLGLWEALAPYHWAIKPKGTVFPYFCCLVKGERVPVKVRLLLLEGWQTFHDFVRSRVDRNFGFYSSPMEFAHFELIVLDDGDMKLFRHDPGYMPQEANATQRALCERMLWEVFGVMMRVETDRQLPLRFATEKAIFARVEDPSGNWSDEPLPIPDARPHVERIAFQKADIAKAKDLPFAQEESIELDFRMTPEIMTKEKRPRCAYMLVAVDGSTGESIVRDCVTVNPELGLRGLWESIPQRVLSHIIARGRIPGVVKLVSGRVFRMMRPLCMDLPFKLSLHDSLPRLEAAFAVR